MKIKFSPVFKRFAGWLAIVSLTLLQAVPSYALRPLAAGQEERTQSSLKQSLRLSAGNATSGFEEIPAEVAAEAELRRWKEDKGTGFFITPQGGRVAIHTNVPGLDVNIFSIDREAQIYSTAVVLGEQTVLKKGAQVYGIVQDAEVHENAVQRGILRTLVSLAEDWNPKFLGAQVPSDPAIMTKISGKEVIKSVLGKGARIETNEVELINTHVDSVDDDNYRTILGLGGMYQNVEIGAGNRHVGQGRIKVMFPTRFEDLVTVMADEGVVQEFAEARIPMGRTYAGDAHGYIEFTGSNGYLWMDGVGTVHEVSNLPSVGVSIGEIFASFDGTLPLKEATIPKLTSKQGSGHWWVGGGAGTISAGAVVIGLHHGAVTETGDLLKASNVTAPAGFVVLQNSVTGIPFPGSHVTGLSQTKQQNPLWVFREHPEVVWGLVYEAWQQAKRVAELRAIQNTEFDKNAYLKQAAIDLAQWPQRMLSTVSALAGQRNRSDVKQQADSLRKQFSMEANTPQLLDQLVEGTTAKTNGYSDAVALARKLWSESPLSKKDAVVRDALKQHVLWSDQDRRFFENGAQSPIVQSSVEKDPTAVVIGSNRLTGNTYLGRGVIVVGSELHDVRVEGVSEADYAAGKRVLVINSRVQRTSVGEGTSLVQVVADGMKLGKNSDFRLSRLERGAVGDQSWASGAYFVNSAVGSKAELKTGSYTFNTTAGNTVIIGGILMESVVGDGYVMNHAGAAGFGVRASNIPVKNETGKLLGTVPNPTNHSDGVLMGDPSKGPDQVFLDGHVMMGAHAWLKTVTDDGELNPVHIGAGSFVKGFVPPGQRVIPLQFFDAAVNGSANPSLVLDRLGPSFIQFLIGYPLRKANPDQAQLVAYLMPTLIREAIAQWDQYGKAMGFSPEQIAAVKAQLSDEHLNSGNWNSVWDPGRSAPEAVQPGLVLQVPLFKTPDNKYAFGGPKPSVDSKKPVVSLESVPVQNRVLAIELGGTFIRVALVDNRGDGKILLTVPDAQIAFIPNVVHSDASQRQTVLDQIAAQEQALLRAAGIDAAQIGKKAVSSPGIIDPSGFVNLQYNLPFTGQSLAQLLQADVMNDMVAAVFSEATPAAFEGVGRVFYATISSGVGAADIDKSGQVTNRELGGLAVPGGKLEDFVSGIALGNLARQKVEQQAEGFQRILQLADGDKQKIEGVTVGLAFAEGNPVAVELVNNAARILADGIVSMTRTVADGQPESVRWILGGGVGQGIGQRFLSLVDEQVRKNLGPSSDLKIFIQLSTQNPQERGLVGAARKTAAGQEETITLESAAQIVRGWDQLQLAQQQAVVQSLADHGYTTEKHLRNSGLVVNGSSDLPASFVAFPPVVDGTPRGNERENLLATGLSPAVLQKQGVIIAAAGEGSRLLQAAIEQQLLPSDGADIYTKPTAPVTPVRGQSTLGYQLETLADMAATHGVSMPVRVVLHPEVGRKVADWIAANRNFGLQHLELVFQGMNPALDETGQIVLRDDNTVSFNPDGTGGVVQAALANRGEQWFLNQLGQDGRVQVINGDMLLEANLVGLVAGVGETKPVVGIGYRYPLEKESPTGPHRFKLGTFTVLNEGGRTVAKIVEYKERGLVTGMAGAVVTAEQAGTPIIANSGVYAFPVAGLAAKTADLVPHHQKDKDAAGVAEKVQKVENFATDIPATFSSDQVGILSVDQAVLTPVKDAAALKQVRDGAVARERARAQALGIKLSDRASVEFHPALLTAGRVQIGKNVRVEGNVGIYFGPNGVTLYRQAQPDKPWEPFAMDQTETLRFASSAAGVVIRIPDNTVFSETGITAGAEERGQLPSATVQRANVGVVAATPRGLALGVAIQQGVQGVEVAFVADNEAQASGLEERGVRRSAIFLAPQYGSVSAAADAATEWLSAKGFSAQPLGVNGPVTGRIELVLSGLGIQLAAGAEEIWNNFVNNVTAAMSAQA